jgi:hypothetical protein
MAHLKLTRNIAETPQPPPSYFVPFVSILLKSSLELSEAWAVKSHADLPYASMISALPSTRLKVADKQRFMNATPYDIGSIDHNLAS